MIFQTKHVRSLSLLSLIWSLNEKQENDNRMHLSKTVEKNASKTEENIAGKIRRSINFLSNMKTALVFGIELTRIMLRQMSRKKQFPR